MCVVLDGKNFFLLGRPKWKKYAFLCLFSHIFASMNIVYKYAKG